jgi:hypothetical protein
MAKRKTTEKRDVEAMLTTYRQICREEVGPMNYVNSRPAFARIAADFPWVEGVAKSYEEGDPEGAFFLDVRTRMRAIQNEVRAERIEQATAALYDGGDDGEEETPLYFSPIGLFRAWIQANDYLPSAACLAHFSNLSAMNERAAYNVIQRLREEGYGLELQGRGAGYVVTSRPDESERSRLVDLIHQADPETVERLSAMLATLDKEENR